MAGAIDKSESLKSLLTIVEKCVECPVCLETAKVPFKLCSRGHIVCFSCTTKINKCPTCEGLFRPTEDNPVCLKNILEALPRCCIYSQDGCEEIVEPGNDHEEFCGFRPVFCRILNCPVKMPVVKVLDHYKEHHVNANIITERYVEGLPYPTFVYTPVWWFENLFWILRYEDTKSDQLQIYFLVTPIGKLAHDYYLQVTMENVKNGDFVVTNTLKATVTSCKKKVTFNDYALGEIGLSGENKRFSAYIPMWQLNSRIDQVYTEVKFKLFFFNKGTE